MSKRKPRYREDDILGKLPPLEMDEPEDFLLSDEEFEDAWRWYTQVHAPHRWFDAERVIRSDRMARTLLMNRDETPGDDRAHADVPDEHDVAIQLLEEALPHLPNELAEQVRQFLEK